MRTLFVITIILFTSQALAYWKDGQHVVFSHTDIQYASEGFKEEACEVLTHGELETALESGGYTPIGAPVTSVQGGLYYCRQAIEQQGLVNKILISVWPTICPIGQKFDHTNGICQDYQCEKDDDPRGGLVTYMGSPTCENGCWEQLIIRENLSNPGFTISTLYQNGQMCSETYNPPYFPNDNPGPPPTDPPPDDPPTDDPPTDDPPTDDPPTDDPPTDDPPTVDPPFDPTSPDDPNDPDGGGDDELPDDEPDPLDPDDPDNPFIPGSYDKYGNGPCDNLQHYYWNSKDEYAIPPPLAYEDCQGLIHDYASIYDDFGTEGNTDGSGDSDGDGDVDTGGTQDGTGFDEDTQPDEETTCDQPPICDADPWQCTTLRIQWEERCKNEQEAEDLQESADSLTDDIVNKTRNVGTLDQNRIQIQAACPPIPQMSIMGSTYTLDATILCDLMSVAGSLIVAFTTLLAGRVALS